MKKSAQRLHQQGGEYRAGDRKAKQRFSAARQQSFQPRMIAAEFEPRDVMSDGRL